MKPAPRNRFRWSAPALAALTLAGCASSGSDGRAVVSVDRQGRAVYASDEQQAQIDRARRTNELLAKLASGERTAQSLSEEERTLVSAALAARKRAR